MLFRFMSAVLLMLWASLGVAQEAKSPVPEIEATISAQMEAFKRDDFDEAFGYASPSIQGIFGNSERFGQMVRQGYPMVWRPAEVRYLDLREIAGALWQRVEVQDAQGALHYLDYRMELRDGKWKISGVQILRPPELSA